MLQAMGLLAAAWPEVLLAATPGGGRCSHDKPRRQRLMLHPALVAGMQTHHAAISRPGCRVVPCTAQEAGQG